MAGGACGRAVASALVETQVMLGPVVFPESYVSSGVDCARRGLPRLRGSLGGCRFLSEMARAIRRKLLMVVKLHSSC